MLTAAYALHLDREHLDPLWTLPFRYLEYRQIMYLVVVQSTVTALAGIRLRWHRVTRTGAAGEALVAQKSPGRPSIEPMRTRGAPAGMMGIWRRSITWMTTWTRCSTAVGSDAHCR